MMDTETMSNKRALDWAIVEELLSETQLRKLNMLHHIPDAPNTITTQELRKRLKEDGFEVSLRGIQRDLAALQDTFPLVMREDPQMRLYHWSWQV